MSHPLVTDVDLDATKVLTYLIDENDRLRAKLAKAVEALKHAAINMPHPDQLIDDTLKEITDEA